MLTGNRKMITVNRQIVTNNRKPLTEGFYTVICAETWRKKSKLFQSNFRFFLAAPDSNSNFLPMQSVDRRSVLMISIREMQTNWGTCFIKLKRKKEVNRNTNNHTYEKCMIPSLTKR